MRMHDILTDPYSSRLGRVAGPLTLLAFDFDGTLAPIVAQPERAAMRESTRVRLAELAALRTVAIISGRALADIQPRLAGVPAAAIVGNHGIEPSPQMATARATVARWLPLLTRDVGSLAGVVIENKGQSVAVHYRHADSGDDALSAIRASVACLGPGVRCVEGIEVLNLVPVGAPNKGDALQRLRRETGAATVLFVGDEETDEDAFATLDNDTSIGIRVGMTEDSRARYFVPSQDDIEALLDLLLVAVREHDRRSAVSMHEVQSRYPTPH